VEEEEEVERKEVEKEQEERGLRNVVMPPTPQMYNLVQIDCITKKCHLKLDNLY